MTVLQKFLNDEQLDIRALIELHEEHSKQINSSIDKLELEDMDKVKIQGALKKMHNASHASSDAQTFPIGTCDFGRTKYCYLLQKSCTNTCPLLAIANFLVFNNHIVVPEGLEEIDSAMLIATMVSVLAVDNDDAAEMFKILSNN